MSSGRHDEQRVGDRRKEGEFAPDSQASGAITHASTRALPAASSGKGGRDLAGASRVPAECQECRQTLVTPSMTSVHDGPWQNSYWSKVVRRARASTEIGAC